MTHTTSVAIIFVVVGLHFSIRSNGHSNSISRSLLSLILEDKCSPLMATDTTNNNNNNLSRAVKEGDRFNNPWSTWKGMPGAWALMKFAMDTDHSGVPDEKTLDRTLPIVEPDFEFDAKKLSYTWIGHSTVVLHLDGLTILTDPIFSDRASPTQVIGPTRYRRPAVTVDQLPPIDAVVISHNHYDHLDLTSVQQLNKRFGSSLHWFVPLGLSPWMRSVGCETVTELDWWQHSSIAAKPDVHFILTPAQHWTRRGAFDERKVLWGSWTVVGPNHRFFFAGDTGYCPAFKEIGQMYGPFDIAAIPIGAYAPRWFMEAQHIDPEQAVLIHQDIKSKLSVAIHWGTFALAHEPYLEPLDKLNVALKDRKLNEKEFIAISHGKTIEI